MVYQMQQWFDDNTAFPLSADRMTHIEEGIAGAAGAYEPSTVMLTLASGWSAISGREPRITRYANGLVLMAGQLSSPAINNWTSSQFTTLPVGFRPTFQEFYNLATATRVDGKLPGGYISITAAGVCTAQFDAAVSAGASLFVNGIIWQAA